MKRVLAIAVVLAAVVAVLFVVFAGGDNGGTYRVRAIFMNAFSVIKGEDVKIAGVKVGKIESLDVTPDKKAAVVLRIDKSGFDDFRADAECTIRPQSLIGEKFVECTPTQPRPENAQKPPPLRKITRGPGKGQYLLPVSQTSKPVDLDLVNNILRLPYRERLTIILNELGTGLAGRGDDLRQAIVNADPALKETDRVLAVLAAQNRTLAKLADDGDTILAPLARERRHVAGFVTHANTVAEATAERSGALRENIDKLPAFLRELRPTMQRLGGLADEMTPVLTDLGDNATSINTFIEGLGPFSQAGIPAFQSLGAAADVGGPALVKSQPIISDVGKLASTAKPVANNLDSLLTSLRDTGGIEQLLDFLFYTVSSTNGFDSYGHYLRAGLILNTCSTYSITPASDCLAKFNTGSSGSARAASAATPSYDDTRRSDDLRRLDAFLHGKQLPKTGAQPEPVAQSAPVAQPQATASEPAAQSVAPDARAAKPLLDYLLGGGG
jgi:phospholipid/cholesterol/gamma-HCH transport system substrate-binding protein